MGVESEVSVSPLEGLTDFKTKGTNREGGDVSMFTPHSLVTPISFPPVTSGTLHDLFSLIGRLVVPRISLLGPKGCLGEYVFTEPGPRRGSS